VPLQNPQPAGPDTIVPCGLCGRLFKCGLAFCPGCGLQRQTFQAPQPYQQLHQQAAGQPVPHQPNLGYLTDLQRRRGRRGAWVAAAAVAAALVAGGVVYALVPSGGKSVAAASVPNGPGVVFRSDSGHFAARFPATPTQQTVPASFGSIKFSLIIAVDQPSRTAVECEKLSQSMPSEEVSSALDSAIRSTASAAGSVLISDSPTTFQGHVAEEGQFTGSDGTQMTALAFEYSSTRTYELLAPTATFANLTASFVAVP
jgi:hypothetical protein